jgi:Xaa-Pro aminopeptidase
MADTIVFDKEVYKSRRDKFVGQVKSGKYLFLGNDETGANYRDNTYPFRQDSTFLYYFGINQPNLAVIINADENKTILFGDEISIEHVIWMGTLPSLKSLAEEVGITEVMPYKKLLDYVSQDIQYLPPYRGDHYILLQSLTGKNFEKTDGGISVKMIKAVVAQRSIKEAGEIELLEKAVIASNQMHRYIMTHARAGMKEYQLVGMAAQQAWHTGCTWSFNPIMTINGQTLHNHYYGNTLEEGNMLLFDGGCQLPSMYAGDITRTIPVGKRFSTIQEEVYQIVLDALDNCVTVLKPGVKYYDVHLLAAQTIFEGLKSLGITKGDTEAAVLAGAHTLFFQCGLGHMMGLDVHDMENLGEQYVGYRDGFEKSKAFGFKSLRLGKELEKGFVITVEPGIYFIPELIDLRKSEGLYKDFINYDKLESFKTFGGIRLEDDYFITDKGSHRLGDYLEKSLDEVYTLRENAF